jgi:lysozyme family protein
MMSSFEIAFAKLLPHEGGYTAGLPGDTGGETYKGVARNYNKDWVGWKIIDSHKSGPNFPKSLDSVKELQECVAALYKSSYWSTINGDSIADQTLANCVFDMSVNAGPSAALKILAQAVASQADAFTVARIRYYRTRPLWPKYAASWAGRAVDY